MHIALVFPVLPPHLDGIGDYTSCLSQALAHHGPVSIYTAASSFDAIPGVNARQEFSTDRRSGILDLAKTVCAERPDWLVLQYNPFSYGRWGLNPYISRLLGVLKKTRPETRIALMVHEPYVPVDELKNAVMTTWQRLELWRIGKKSDLVFFPIDPWVKKFSRWFASTPVRHLPVGSNIPFVSVKKEAIRKALGIPSSTLVVGVFGTMHPSRLTPFIQMAMRGLVERGFDVRLLYIGPHGPYLRKQVRSGTFIDAGKLAAEEVSRHFQAMDLYLAPFRKGVSARRGSFLVGIQHGIPTISTYGEHTDDFLRRADEAAFLLAPDNDGRGFVNRVCAMATSVDARNRLAAAGRDFFAAHFSWSRLAERLLSEMESLHQVEYLVHDAQHAPYTQ